MDGNSASGGGLIPFRTLVLDEHGAALVPRPRPASERARQFRAQAGAPATVVPTPTRAIQFCRSSLGVGGGGVT